MDAKCEKCGMQTAVTWSFCPQCGTAMRHEAVRPAVHVPSTLTTAKGGFGGLLVGLVITPAFIIVGTLLCLTGLGAFLGVPMIIVGVIAPLAGSVLGLREHRGKCPDCGTRVISVADGHGHYCPACSKEFDITNGHVVKAG